MALSPNLVCRVITPEEAVLEAEATQIVFPAHDGQVGVLPGRAPFIARLGTGELRLDTASGTQRLVIDQGFAQVVDNQVVILTHDARRPEDLNGDLLREELRAASEQKAHSPRAIKQRLAAQDRARAKLRTIAHRT